MCLCAWYSACVHVPVRTRVCVMFFGFICRMYDSYATVSRVSRAKNVTPLKHTAAGLCWNLSLSLSVFTAVQQRQTKCHADLTLWNDQHLLLSVKVKSRFQWSLARRWLSECNHVCVCVQPCLQGFNIWLVWSDHKWSGKTGRHLYLEVTWLDF